MFILFLMFLILIVLAAFIVPLYKKGSFEVFIITVFLTVFFLFSTLAATAFKIEKTKEETAVSLGWTAFTQEELDNMSRNEMKQYPCIGFHYYYYNEGEK